MVEFMERCTELAEYGLGIHSSSPELGIGISNFTDETRCQTWNLGHDLSTHLHQYLAELIQPQSWSDLAFIAVAKGPGSFTGTRIGVVTARTLAQQLEIPLFAISTLAAVAWSHDMEDDNQAIAVQMPASRGEVFGAVYRKSVNDLKQVELLPDSVMKPEVWQQTLAKLTYPYKLIEVSSNIGASVFHLLELAYLDWQQGLRPHWSEALPFYGQHPIE
ncbi:tRNA (adenosine(37)-N6)-threonylcarbamoyltransferase complex dimerization subunit type 1 TsaB [Phormidium sp. LEGE 05292]|uniref:tRNA (adenosine(37)-N6)-threonylcarbamoyltransferase complex dimerization subunit type 1 TsaB n=1 Tax=[Phormidium] sp. LEGE 05292 TaxID=767427 RepID=UPI0018808FD9|nr:tRNA (adenosine(37)-N6)-threonylcarbamoyltransferase complex dimerization subunit type 1 TsaB [Phormidium sp. LEGE 05292]MBE9227308.1 tRNA (adenosine(37)-N6)-threonylcarbamoyltransferase complex dimerization subunit type 1 TsaB [Phormidium sp. LEGE 05292]